MRAFALPDFLRRSCLEALEARCLLSVNVTTWHYDLTRQGLNAGEVALTPANVNSSSFGRLMTYPVLGQIYAQPLYVSNFAIAGGTHNVVFVATQHNDVYALDADSNAGPNNGVLWHVNLGPSAAMPNSYFGNRYGPYHDINPQIGITSTPVIDLATGTMYLDAFTNDVAGQNAYSHHIWALDIATGAQKATPMLVAAQMQGNAFDSAGGVVTFAATQQLQRPALTLLNGVLYVAYSGYADTDPYHGWVLGFNPATLQLIRAFNTTPNKATVPDQTGAGRESEGGIWQTGNGLVSDGTSLYFLVGNGDYDVTVGDYGDSVLKITPDASTPAAPNINGYGLAVSSFFTPYNEQALANADTDLGSGGSIILPDLAGLPKRIIGGGKQGLLYVMDRDSLGGHNNNTSGPDAVLQTISNGGSFFNSPAYFNNTVYTHASGTFLKAFSVSTTSGLLSAAPIASGATSYGYPGATPTVSANGNANGIVWDTQYSTSHAVLRAYNATPSGSSLVELFNSNSNVARDQLGPGVKFTTPVVADGKVFVGADGALAIFGLLVPPSSPPSAPANLAASAPVANQILLTWTDTSLNEGSFNIDRSTDGSNFSAYAVASVNATSFADTGVTPGVQYWYRIRASNTAGDSATVGPVSAVAVGVSVPVMMFPFNEGAGTSTVDTAGGNNGTLVGNTLPQWVPGRIGPYALSFSGDGVYKSTTPQSAVQTLNSMAATLGATASLTAWVKTTQVGNSNTNVYQNPAITGVERAGSNTDIRWGYLDTTGHIGISAGSNNGFVSTSVINDNTWHHVAFTRNSGTGAVQIFVDGVLQTSATGATGFDDAVFRLLGAQSDVGSDGGAFAGANYFNGSLDDIRIYNRVITANEVAALGTIPATPTGLTANALSGSLIQLNWTNVSAFTQNVAIERRTGTSGAFTQIALLAGTPTVYNDTNVTAGTQYFYQVRAVDFAGASAPAGPVNTTPPLPVIIGRYTFYNNSIYDGQNGSSNVADDRSLAPDKSALLPGQTATLANYTSYAKGLNGILIDFTNLEHVPSVSDFSFRVGNSSNPATWTVPPAPPFVTYYPGRGVGGSYRMELLWDDNQIQNQWLQVTVKNDGQINIAAPDVFYLGNAIGESGNSAADARVTAIDEIAARAHDSGGGSVTLSSLYDYNRDGVVNTADQAVARANVTNFIGALQLITVPSGLNLMPASQTDAPATTLPAPASAASAPPAANPPSTRHRLKVSPRPLVRPAWNGMHDLWRLQWLRR